METQLEKNRTEHELPVREKHVTREPGTYQGPHFEPDVDIYETEDALVVSADLPGVSAQKITTDVRDNLLTLTAQVQPVDARWKPLYREYAVGNYTRQFRLGQQIDQSRITAELKDGVLTLTLPKAERNRPRRIEVKTG
jgi:HSP20 family protein